VSSDHGASITHAVSHDASNTSAFNDPIHESFETAIERADRDSLNTSNSHTFSHARQVPDRCPYACAKPRAKHNSIGATNGSAVLSHEPSDFLTDEPSDFLYDESSDVLRNEPPHVLTVELSDDLNHEPSDVVTNRVTDCRAGYQQQCPDASADNVPDRQYHLSR
jgi:hypothetical protein